MSGQSDLRLDWCSVKAAKYAVEKWHYSGTFPAGKFNTVGVWEEGSFIGCVIYGQGANYRIGMPYKLKMDEVSELTRVALSDHKAKTSRILSIAGKMVARKNKGLRLFVSYADTAEGHHGGIYQANGWVYVGSSKSVSFVVHGKAWHPKSLHSRFGKNGNDISWIRSNIDPKAEYRRNLVKHKYLMPLDRKMAEFIEPLRQDYSKRDQE